MFGMFGKSFPKELKFLYWNVRHFNASSNNKGWLGFRESRAERVFMKISEENPDIFGISEVTDDEVFKAMEKILPDYSYSITDGSQSQETLVGVRNSLSPVFRQKAEFKGGSSTLRPAALTRIFNGDNPVRVLFCHLKSSTEADSFELRKKMCQEAAKLKRSFNPAAGAQGPNFVFAGDMNTMGRKVRGQREQNLSGAQEIEALEKYFKRNGMVFLPKTHGATYNGGSSSSYKPADLDHVVVSDHMRFKPVNENGALVSVKGWTELRSASAQDKWIEEYSDHAYLTWTMMTR